MELSTFDRIWLACLRAPLRAWVRPRVVPEDLRQRFARHPRPICYVLNLAGVADLVVLEKVCDQFGLPSPFTSLKFPLPSCSVFFLERRIGFWRDRSDRRISDNFRQLIAAAMTDPSLDVDLLPVNVLFGRKPEREGSWLRTLLSEGWERVGRLRRFLSVLIYGRDLLVQFGEPVSVRAVLGDAGESVAVRRLTRTLRTAVARQRAAAIGPDLSHRRTIVTQVLRTAQVRRAMHDEMRTKRLTRREAIEQAQDYANEIAADYSHRFVTVMARVLTWVWTRLYDGVQLHHEDELRAIAEDNEVVFVPCHRSHMDYILLSYAIYFRGFAIPHIAAGINLDMPLVGRFLRKGGAFYIRRSFKGNALYTAVLMNYLGIIISRGHSIEYFIEGGRSRTGRLLQPKTGMLSMTLRSYLRDPRRPITFLPVYFGYERLVEGKTYIGELSGKPKEKESVFGMLRTLPLLRQKFGKVHVSFGEPIRLQDLFAQLGLAAPNAGEIEEKPSWLAPAVDRLAQQIMTNINAAACLTPINLIALVLLAMPKQAMLESDLTRQIDLYASLLRQVPYSRRAWVTDVDGHGALRHAERMGVVQRIRHALGDVIEMNEQNSVLMTYFRNNILHLIALPSLIACCFLNNREMRTEDIQRLMWRIYPYVGDELFLRWNESEVSAVVLELLNNLRDHKLLELLSDDVWQRPPTGTVEAVQLSVLAEVTVQIIERYYLVIAVLLKAGSGHIDQSALETQCEQMAQRMSLLYELNSPEFFDKSLFKNFIDLLRARHVLEINAEGRLTFTERLSLVAADAQIVLHERIRNSILQVTHH
ncbi:MAG TPA: glycerol-3-phosphate 1-O-acyltransferase PlsB [Steroidobacteraceae bacterium]|nr:glycerol-3-phosphate 1-O-acyltransferase PlsB [Steroidobacteraceae bacterium]